MVREWTLPPLYSPPPSHPLLTLCVPPHLPLLLLCSCGRGILSRLTRCIPSSFVPPLPPLSSSSSPFLSFLPLNKNWPLGSSPLAPISRFSYLLFLPFFFSSFFPLICEKLVRGRRYYTICFLALQYTVVLVYCITHVCIQLVSDQITTYLLQNF